MNPLPDTVHRRAVLRAATGLAAAGVATGAGSRIPAATGPITTLQPLAPGAPSPAGTYVPATPTNVVWGRLPTGSTRPVAVVDSGAVVTIDTVSHEGVLEDQGQDPLAYFTGQGVAAADVLADAVEVARRTPTFPLAPFLGVMGVARDTDALVDSVPPTDAGGNLDINELGVVHGLIRKADFGQLGSTNW